MVMAPSDLLYYPSVPRGMVKNLKARRALEEKVAGDKARQTNQWHMCADDILYYLNMYAWVYSPLYKRFGTSVLPFITYDFQNETVLLIKDAIETGYDLLIEKSRDMGASYMILYVMEWFWHFRPMQTFHLGSRKEELVDKLDEAGTLFWKIRNLHKNQPDWLKPIVADNLRHLFNKENGSCFTGESTNPGFGVGPRFTAIMLDEFARVGEKNPGVDFSVKRGTADTSSCRLFNSTHRGMGTAFYQILKDGLAQVLGLHWIRHPEKSRGLYKVVRGQVEIIDKEYKFPPDYKWLIDGNPKHPYRSPWFDAEVKRRGSALEIAEELNMDPVGSGGRFFDQVVLDNMSNKYGTEPTAQGEITNGKFEPEADGRLFLWTDRVDNKGKFLSKHDTVMGVDVATGTGASNSAISIVDKTNNTKIAEFVTPHINPVNLGKYALELAHWLGEPHMIWDAIGPGMTFGETVLEGGYSNIYFKTQDRDIRKQKSMTPGFFADKANTRALMASYREALTSEQFINPGKVSLKECEFYVFSNQGGVEHIGSRMDDPSGAGANHGDRAMADALANKALGEVPVIEEKKEVVHPYGSFGWRFQEYEKEQRLLANGTQY